MRKRLPWVLALSLVSILSGTALAWAGAAPTKPESASEGFVTLFNGKDLTGWHGLETMDPRKFAAMSAEEKDKAACQGRRGFEKTLARR